MPPALPRPLPRPKLPVPARLALRACALVLLCAPGCDALGVVPFQGSYVTLSAAWPLLVPMPPLPAPQPVLLPDGEHLDVWAVMPGNRPVRLPADQFTDPKDFPGFVVRPAIDPNDPCMIRALNPDDPCAAPDMSGLSAEDCGAHLLSADAQDSTDASERALQQKAVVQHVRQVLSPATTIATVSTGGSGDVKGKAPAPLLALMGYDPVHLADDAAVRGLPLNADNAGRSGARPRLAACRPYRDHHPEYYLGNPRQLTKPLHGSLYGFFLFSSTDPPQSLGGITFATQTPLQDIQGMLITREKDANPRVPGTVIMTGVRRPPGEGGRGVIRLVLGVMVPGMMGAPPQFMPVGTAAIQTGLDKGLDG